MKLQKLLKYLMDKNLKLKVKYQNAKNTETMDYLKGQIDMINEILKIIK